VNIDVIIVGCGQISAAHVAAILSHPQLRLAGLVSRSHRRASAVADAALLAQGTRPWIASELTQTSHRLDSALVVVCTESGTHFEVARTAILCGAHVLIEKPVATRLSDARRLIEAASSRAAAGRVSSVVSQRRFAPATLALRGCLDRGRLGDVTSASVVMPWWRSDEYYSSRPWRGTWAGDGGGALLNQGVHYADLLIALLGPPIEVYGMTATSPHRDIEAEDTAGAVLRFASGAIGTVLATTAANPGYPTGIRISGTRASAQLSDDELVVTDATGANVVRVAPSAADQSQRSGAFGSPALPELVHARQYRDVVDSITAGRRPQVGLTQGAQALALVKSVYIAQRLGAPVRFDAVLAGDHDVLDRSEVADS
jgi:UDP-N-acetyl-2-amino-2-deoxyglucuronate dehydrogenase